MTPILTPHHYFFYCRRKGNEGERRGRGKEEEKMSSSTTLEPNQKGILLFIYLEEIAWILHSTPNRKPHPNPQISFLSKALHADTANNYSVFANYPESTTPSWMVPGLHTCDLLANVDGSRLPQLGSWSEQMFFKNEGWGGSRQEEIPERGSELLAKEMKCRKRKEKRRRKHQKRSGGWEVVAERLTVDLAVEDEETPRKMQKWRGATPHTMSRS